MTKPATRAELERIPVEPYGSVRPLLRTGDVLLAAGEHWISHVISRATRSPMTHAGIVYVMPDEDRVLLLEAVEGAGVRLAPLSRLVWGTPRQRYRGMLFVLRHREQLTRLGLRSASQFGFDRLTARYGYWTLGVILTRILLGLRQTRTEIEDDAWVCSEFASSWLMSAGLGLDAHASDYGFVTPDALWRDPRLELVARLA